MLLSDNRAITPEMLIKSIPSILLVFDRGGTLTAWNEAAGSALGLGDPSGAGGDRELSPELLEIVRSCMELCEMVRLDECVMEVGGSSRKFGFTANPLASCSEVMGAVVTGRDITERVIVLKEIEDLRRRAGIEKIARQLAHELRNPLNSMKVHAQFIELLFPEDDPNRRYASVISEEVDHMDRLLTSLRDLSRAQGIDLQFSPPEPAIFRAVDLMVSVARAKGVEIRTKVDTLNSVLHDPEKIQQVIINILKNAVEAVRPGGQILLKAGRDEQGGIWIEVMDDGPGIDPEVAGQIFDLFFTTKGRLGEGIGLAVCREIIERHRGRIFLTRAKGWSTCFRLEIPPP